MVRLSREGQFLNSDRRAWEYLSEPDPTDELDLWLESYDLPEETSHRMTIKPVRTGGNGLRRHDAGVQRAAQENWEADYMNAKEHATSVLDRMMKL
jgi:hypothetical protein